MNRKQVSVQSSRQSTVYLQCVKLQNNFYKMRATYVVFLLCLFIPLIIAQRSGEKCVGDRRIVTINEGYEPYWFQMYFRGCIQGNKVQDIPAYHIKISEKYGSPILEISNFPLLKEVSIDTTNINHIPEFLNLPKIEKISMFSNKLTNIPSKAVSQVPVKELVFSRNAINTIGKGAFGKDVEIIFLTCNNLTTLSPTWFRNPPQIKKLKLGGNKISAVPDNMFKDFINLDDLELRNNQILTLGVASISGPTQMIWLHLGYNNISDIKPDVFGPKINITNFDVEYNRLSFLHQGMMDKITARNILTWGNPWQCPCLKPIDVWIAKNNENFSPGIPRDEDPSCVTALSFRDVCVPFVDDDLYETFIQRFEISPFKFC